MPRTLVPAGWRRRSRRVAFWVRYQGWRLKNPGGRFSDYYVERFAGRLERPGSHANLGNVPAEPERTQAFAGEVLRRLRELGMRPEHRCVDYGCGSLHVGGRLIDYLAPGRYVGLDVTELFFRDALQRLDTAWLARKRPRLERIRPQVLRELEDDPPDFLVCTHVLILVPPRELRRFARRLGRLVGARTRCLLELELRARTRQPTETFFWHGRQQVEQAFAREGFALRRLGSWPAIRDDQRESTLVELVRRSPDA